MFNKIFLALLGLFPYLLIAQGIKISTSASAPHQSAGLEIDFQDKGLLLPRLTNAQRDSIVSPSVGLMIYNLSTSCINLFTGSLWKESCFDCINTVTVNAPNSVCAGDSAILTATSGPGATFSWVGPNGFTSSLASIVLNPASSQNSGVYSVVSNVNNCLSAPAMHQLSVIAASAGQLSASPANICQGATTQLSTNGSQGTLLWQSSSDGITFSTIPGATSITYLTPALSNTTYYRIIAGSGNCLDTSAVLTVNVSGSFSASGGTITNVNPYTVHTFTSSGLFTVTCPATVEYLIVGGGGGGGDGNASGGAGGGGGVVVGSMLISSGTYNVTVGAGGIGSLQQDQVGQPGQNSVFNGITALGGGSGGGYNNVSNGGNGGSGGGGGGPTGTGAAGVSLQTSPAGGIGYGNNGAAKTMIGSGSRGGGGGGAGGPANNEFGGPGFASSISGSTVYYGAGGGGAGYLYSAGTGGLGGGGNGGTYNTSSANGGNGTPNTGSGGGGSGDGPIGGVGGSGIVIIRYQ